MSNTINLSKKEFGAVLVKAHDRLQRDLFENEGYKGEDKVDLEIALKMIETTIITGEFSKLLKKYLFESEGE